MAKISLALFVLVRFLLIEQVKSYPAVFELHIVHNIDTAAVTRRMFADGVEVSGLSYNFENIPCCSSSRSITIEGVQWTASAVMNLSTYPRTPAGKKTVKFYNTDSVVNTFLLHTSDLYVCYQETYTNVFKIQPNPAASLYHWRTLNYAKLDQELKAFPLTNLSKCGKKVVTFSGTLADTGAVSVSLSGDFVTIDPSMISKVSPLSYDFKITITNTYYPNGVNPVNDVIAQENFPLFFKVKDECNGAVTTEPPPYTNLSRIYTLGQTTTLQEVQWQFVVAGNCPIDNYQVECTAPSGTKTTAYVDSSFTASSNLSSPCARFKYYTSLSIRKITFDATAGGFDNTMAGNYTMKVLGSKYPNEPSVLEFQIMIVPSYCASATFTASPYNFLNFKPDGKYFYSSSKLDYYYKMPKQMYSMDIFLNSKPGDCQVSWKLLTDGIANTFSGITLQIDQNQPNRVILVIYYAVNQQSANQRTIAAELKGSFYECTGCMGTAKTASISFTINLLKNCYGTMTDLQFDPTDFGIDKVYTVTNTMPLKYNQALWVEPSDQIYCHYPAANYKLKQEFFLFGQDFNPAIFSHLDNSYTVTIKAVKNSDIRVYDSQGNLSCDLSPPSQLKCQMRFHVDLISLYDPTVVIGEWAYGTVTFQSECYRLNEITTAWKWDVADQDKVNAGYALRESQVEFKMPKFAITLFSGAQNLVQVCGPVVYTTKAGVPIDPNTIPIVYTIPPKTTEGELVFQIKEGLSDNSEGAIISVEATDEELPDKKAVPSHPYQTKYTLWTSVHFQLYPTTFNHAGVEFMIRDYCFGMTYGEEYFKISQVDTVVEPETKIMPNGVEITKYALSAPTTLSLARLIYYQYKKTPADPDVKNGCGTLIYSVNVSAADTSLARLSVSDRDYVFIVFDPSDESFIGTRTFNLQIKSDLVVKAPKHKIPITITVLKCRVNEVKAAQIFFDAQIQIGATLSQPIASITQTPACKLPVQYTLTVIENLPGSEKIQQIPDGKVGAQTSPIFASIQRDSIIIAPQLSDVSLASKTYSIFFSSTILTHTDIQQPINTVSEPFFIEIVDELFSPAPPALLYDFKDQVHIELGKTEVMQIAKFTDGGGATLSDWKIVGLALNWVTKLDSDDIQFRFVTPKILTIKSFAIEIKLKDSKGVASFYKVKVSIKKSEKEAIESTFNPFASDNQTKNKNEIERSKVISIAFTEIDKQGFFFINFSNYIKVPRSANEWNESNVGSLRLNIAFEPSIKSLDVHEEAHVRCNWSVASLLDLRDVNASSKSTRQLKQEGLVQIKGFKIKLSFSEPLVVSNYREDLDKVRIDVQPEMFIDTYPADFKQTSYIFASLEKGETQLPIPSQQQAGTEESAIKTLKSTLEAQSNAMYAFLATNLILSIFSSALIQFLWALVNAMQIIVLTSLYHTAIPQNAEEFLFAIMKLTTFDVLQTDRFWNYVKKDIGETEPFNERFEAAGYETSDFLLELGPLLFILIFIHISYVSRLVLAFCTRKCKQNWLTRRIRSDNNYKSMLMRYFLEGCLEIGLVAMISVVKFDSERLKETWFAAGYILAFFFLLGLVVSPFYMICAIKQFLKAVKEGNLIVGNRYLQLFSVYKADTFASCAYSILFILRRFTVVIILTLLPLYRLVQILAHLLSTSVMVVYLIRIKPFYRQTVNIQEVLNEITVIIAAHHLYIFTEWVSLEDRIFMGWSLIAVIGVNVAMNMGMLAFVVLHMVYIKSRKKYAVNKRALIMLRQTQKRKLIHEARQVQNFVQFQAKRTVSQFLTRQTLNPLDPDTHKILGHSMPPLFQQSLHIQAKLKRNKNLKKPQNIAKLNLKQIFPSALSPGLKNSFDNSESKIDIDEINNFIKPVGRNKDIGEAKSPFTDLKSPFVPFKGNELVKSAIKLRQCKEYQMSKKQRDLKIFETKPRGIHEISLTIEEEVEPETSQIDSGVWQEELDKIDHLIDEENQRKCVVDRKQILLNESKAMQTYQFQETDARQPYNFQLSSPNLFSKWKAARNPNDRQPDQQPATKKHNARFQQAEQQVNSNYPHDSHLGIQSQIGDQENGQSTESYAQQFINFRLGNQNKSKQTQK